MIYIKPTDLIEMNDLDFLKLLLSGGDNFPGMYRISLKHQAHLAGDDYLKLLSLFDYNKLNQVDSSDRILQMQKTINHQLYQLSDRNKKRDDEKIKSRFPVLMESYLANMNSLVLCAIDNLSPVFEVIPGRSYYFMGSIIHFDENKVVISYHRHSNSYWRKIDVKFEVISEYLNKIFSPNEMAELFYHAETVGEWELKPEVLLKLDQAALEAAASQMHLKSLVIAAPKMSPMPIEFSKPIFLGSI